MTAEKRMRGAVAAVLIAAATALDGRPLGGVSIRHADVMRGGELVFEMH